MKEAPWDKLDVDLGDTTTTKAESTASVVENRREEKFKIDLMAPPSGKSSPERDGVPEIVTDQKPEIKMVPKIEIVKGGEDEKEEFGKQEVGEVRLEQKTVKAADEITLQKQVIKDRILVKESTLDLQLDVEMQDKECGGGKQQVPKQLSKITKNETEAEKAVQSASLPLPLTVPCWPGGLSPLGSLEIVAISSTPGIWVKFHLFNLWYLWMGAPDLLPHYSHLISFLHSPVQNSVRPISILRRTSTVYSSLLG
ncbi:uncharacterized protein LOC143881051 isoform X2 [Tasmannia lanceolata]|uniref:uncharacterized protein LOC143881051 isoform X2 n=1 Tax=Tasmannia lanceolata TaxID=3420 RepID=UPI0040636E98